MIKINILKNLVIDNQWNIKKWKNNFIWSFNWYFPIKNKFILKNNIQN